MPRKKKSNYTKVGFRYWDSRSDGRRRYYTLMQVVNPGGGVKQLSPYMTASERKMFIQGVTAGVKRLPKVL